MTRIYVLLALIMLIWGFNLSALAVLVKNVQPITLTSFRIFIAGISVLIITKIMGLFRFPTKNEWKTIAIITIFNVAMHHTFLAIGLTKTSGANASIILGGAPLVTMLFAILLLRQHISKLRMLGFFIGFIGIVTTSLASGDGISSFSSGDIFIFLSMAMQAFSFILISKLNPTFDPRLLTGVFVKHTMKSSVISTTVNLHYFFMCARHGIYLGGESSLWGERHIIQLLGKRKVLAVR